MSITFFTVRRPIGYMIRCGFSGEVFDTVEDAYAAALVHGDGGCEDAKSFMVLRPGETRAEYYERLEAFGASHDYEVSADSCRQPGTVPIYAEVAPEMNVSNTNAFGILEALGFVDVDDAAQCAIEGGSDESPSWCSGVVSADDLLGRVLMAQALAPIDPGRSPERTIGSQGATVIDAGRRVGYLQEKLETLGEIATWAKSRNLSIAWG